MDGCGQLASFTGIPCFWTELSWSYNQKQTYGVLETGSVFELFYEWTTTKKMKDRGLHEGSVVFSLAGKSRG